MDKITVKIYSKIPHISQIVLGFHMLKSSYHVEFLDCTAENKYPNMAYVEAEFRSKRIIYDVLDGYQYRDHISELVNYSDYYFKRSYSESENHLLDIDDIHKIHPLGFNYHLTYFGSPMNYEPIWKSVIKPLFGKTPETYFNSKRFEGKATPINGPVKILFLTRLWDENKTASDKLKDERRFINQMRIEIIRRLRSQYGKNVLAGLSDDETSRLLAPDLIVSDQITNRRSYLQHLHKADICIGSMGLHESIGWKTGEYVAAAKAIVAEKMKYAVPGEFVNGVNYLEYVNADECIEAVETLVKSHDLLYTMKKSNEIYYRNYLRPDALIQNTIKRIELEMNDRC